ncbi:MAG TPA: universal stress protein [Candidatus Binatia bacterium]|jgi:nucleotide-binding universal stress UspA family protein|nr:universal stress protein [Candidatus Binatia bacterium]
MYKHILIPTDGSELSARAINEGVALAKALHAEVTAITVSETFHTFSLNPMVVTETPEQYQKDSDAGAEKYLSVANDAAKAAGVPYEGVHVMHDHPYEAIIAAAKERGCDLIVMASHGRKGMSALVLGSVTVKVLTHSNIPALVCR